MLSRRRCIHGLILSLAALASSTASSTWAAETTRPELPRPELLIFAAASLTDAMEEIGAAYTRQSGQRVKFSFAASSALARQIEAGGRIDVFLSADLEWMDYLQARNLIAPDSRKNVVGNRLVLIAPKASRLRLAPARGFALARALGSGRLAVADPNAVPAGKYAKAALTALGVWGDVANKLAPAENVRAALVLVERGAAPLGIVYATDAQASQAVRVVGTFPAASHPPIRYPLALLKTSRSGDAAAFRAFLLSRQARTIFTRHGFTAP